MPRPRLNLKKIVDYLTEHGESRAGDVSTALGLSASALVKAAEPGIADGSLVRRQEGRATFWSLGEPVPDAEDEDEQRAPFNAALWADGDLVIYGHQENVDGSITLTGQQVAQIKRLIAWTPPPP